MLRFTVWEVGQGELPPIDVDASVVEIGSAETAHVRLPAAAAEAVHVRIEGGAWRAIGSVQIDGVANSGGDLGAGVTLSIGAYQVRIAEAPAGATATTPQRTESLARELVRSLLGSGAAPSFEVERGPTIGAKRMLAPPESTLVIGRGDEAGWIVVDDDLSRTHAEVRRSWDGIRIADLGSKNGTQVDGATVDRAGVSLRDGMLVELGKVALRFRDPAQAHLRPDGPAPEVTRVRPAATSTSVAGSTTTAVSNASEEAEAPRKSTVPFYAALALTVAALAGLVWVLSW